MKAVTSTNERDLQRRTSKIFRDMGQVFGELPIDAKSLGFMSDIAMTFEGLRVAAETRRSHLERNGVVDPDTTIAHAMLIGSEKVVDDRLRAIILTHPTARWWTQIKGSRGRGLPLQVMGKVLAGIENFDKYYKPGDLAIPPYVTRKPEKVSVRIGEDEEGNPQFEEQTLVRVEGIERFTTVGKLWAYAGLTPDSKEKRGKKGVQRSDNTEFRTMLFRLFQFGFLFTGNSYADAYRTYKERKTQDLIRTGVKIMPTPKGRFCPKCAIEMAVKDARYCPECDSPLALKTEPDGVIFVGHLDAMARRWTVKLFLSHLWCVWREEIGLPVSLPYVLTERARLAERLGVDPEDVPASALPHEHTTYISPWDMIRPEDRMQKSA